MSWYSVGLQQLFSIFNSSFSLENVTRVQSDVLNVLALSDKQPRKIKVLILSCKHFGSIKQQMFGICT